MNADALEKLRLKNAQLRQMVRVRSCMVSCELEHLRGLRAAVGLPAARSRKRARDVNHELSLTSSNHLGNVQIENSAAFLRALQTEVEKRAGGDPAWKLAKDKWMDIATSLRAAGHPQRSPHGLLAAYTALHRSNAAFSTAEDEALCQLVHEKGFDWTVVCAALRQRFGHSRPPFEVAQRYRQDMRRVLVQTSLTPRQLEALLQREPRTCSALDYDALSIAAKCYTTHKLCQVDPRYLQRKMEVLVFERDTPPCFQLYWKAVNVLCRLPLPPRQQLDVMHHAMPLCLQQRSLEELASSLETSAAEVKERIACHLLTVKKHVNRQDVTRISKKLFGNASAARVILQVVVEMEEQELREETH